MPEFTILTVCTGNICRSPLAALLLNQAFIGLPVAAHSAGTQALDGYGMPEPQLGIAAELGVPDGASHRAKTLTLSHVDDADLILAMGREHRSAAAQLTPKALRKAFTLREFARIAQVIPDAELEGVKDRNAQDRLREAVEIAATYRGLALPAAKPQDNDVIDPYRRSSEIYLQSRDELVAALDSAVKYLRSVIER